MTPFPLASSVGRLQFQGFTPRSSLSCRRAKTTAHPDSSSPSEYVNVPRSRLEEQFDTRTCSAGSVVNAMAMGLSGIVVDTSGPFRVAYGDFRGVSPISSFSKLQSAVGCVTHA